jgi:dienelactone hydrolase
MTEHWREPAFLTGFCFGGGLVAVFVFAKVAYDARRYRRFLRGRAK